MEASPAAAAHHGHPGIGARLVLTIIGATVLACGGLMALFYWLITFRWLYFLGLIPFGFGAWLLFTRATGPDHA
jgi:hypothetical protein